MKIGYQKIQRILRDAGLLTAIEKLRYFVSVARYYRNNKKFIAANPGFKLPPEDLAYDAYSAPDWDFYKKSGENTVSFLFSIAKKYLPDVTAYNVLEWGCGPARVIRHLQQAFGPEARVFGSDYNKDTIAWCAESIPGCKFVLNSLCPPLPFDSDFFEFIYSVSVFTHLSETVSQQWIAELFRISKPGGVLVISTNGDSRLNVMLPDEVEHYQKFGFVVRDKVEEGKKMFVAFHSSPYLRDKLFAQFVVLEYVSLGFPFAGQDLWILRKPM